MGQTTTPYVVVTGASEGIGRALAGTFAAHGHNVLLIARDAAALEPRRVKMAAKHGVAVLALPLDVTAADAARRIEAALAAQGGYVDILVNSAGLGLSGPFAGQDPEEIQRLIDLNMTALTRLTRHFLPPMLARGRGGILNVASLGGLMPGPHQAAYYASKAYVISLTRALAAENVGSGLRIAVLAPGPVATNFHVRMGAERSYYVWLIPSACAGKVARSAYRWFRWGWGRTLIIPGLIPTFIAMAARLIPTVLLVPVVAWLLKRRNGV
jgi:short-subunit dehydrogenase